MGTDVPRRDVERLAELVIEHADLNARMFGDVPLEDIDGNRYYQCAMRSAAEIQALADATGCKVEAKRSRDCTEYTVHVFNVEFFHYAYDWRR